MVCKRYKKVPPRPVVGFPLATMFNECVAMDLKFYHGRENPTLENWIPIYGATHKFFSDNGGEFMNSMFIEMCEQMNISVKITAGRSPWSNGMVERHNLVISEMLDRVLAASKCDFDLALAWCFSAEYKFVLQDHSSISKTVSHFSLSFFFFSCFSCLH